MPKMSISTFASNRLGSYKHCVVAVLQFKGVPISSNSFQVGIGFVEKISGPRHNSRPRKRAPFHGQSRGATSQATVLKSG
jgi:hypothetical protein